MLPVQPCVSPKAVPCSGKASYVCYLGDIQLYTYVLGNSEGGVKIGQVLLMCVYKGESAVPKS